MLSSGTVVRSTETALARAVDEKVRIHGDVGLSCGAHLVQTARHPGIAADKELRERAPDEIDLPAAQDANGGIVDFAQNAVGIEREHAVAHAAQKWIRCSCAPGADSSNSCAFLNRYRRFGAKRVQPPLVARC